MLSKGYSLSHQYSESRSDVLAYMHPGSESDTYDVQYSQQEPDPSFSQSMQWRIVLAVSNLHPQPELDTCEVKKS